MGGSGGAILPALLEFPRVESLASISILPLTIYKLIGINSMAQIIIFNFVITILFTSYIFWKIGAQPTTYRLLLLAGVSLVIFNLDTRFNDSSLLDVLNSAGMITVFICVKSVSAFVFVESVLNEVNILFMFFISLGT
jgi:hypothetical protein